MSKKLIAMLIFVVAGSLAVASEHQKPTQLSVSPEPGCTCTDINKNTGKPWTNDECRTACESKRSLERAMGNEGNPFSSLNILANATPANGAEGRPQASTQEPALNQDRLKARMIFSVILVSLVFLSLVGFVAWKSGLLKTLKKKRKKRYRTDQEKAVSANISLPAAPVAALPVTTSDRPGQAVLAPVTQIRQPEPIAQHPAEIVDITGQPNQIESIVFWLGKPFNPEAFPWAKWGSKLSAFTMGWRGFQPEMEVFAGGIEISIQEENRKLWMEVITYAIREVFPVSLKLVIIEVGAEGSVFALMPEESVQYALSGESNVLTLTEGLRQHLLPSVHEHKRLANQ